MMVVIVLVMVVAVMIVMMIDYSTLDRFPKDIYICTIPPHSITAPKEVWNQAMFFECGKLAMPVISSLRAISSSK